MKTILKVAPLIIASFILAVSCTGGAPKDDALFVDFTYQGKDKFYDENPLEIDEFYNPILQGFYPDPSIVRKGEDYYMVTSTFSFFPGVPIFHSTDLINWEQLGHVLSRSSQLPLEGLSISEGIYAPAISYNPANETFYMVTTLVGGPNGGNFLVKTQDPTAEWSEPIYLPEVGGIDPSLFFDDNAKAYLVHNDAPDGEPLYQGHRAIRLWEFDPESDKIVGGGEVVVNGGVDITQNPIWIEAPHLFKKNGKYFLMCAEGGTGTWHSEVIFSSDDVMGPYTPAKENPILTQRNLSEPREYEVTSAGHADITDTPEGEHYGVFLATRPYKGNMYNTGRETFILPVDWSGEFPSFVGGTEPISLRHKMPHGVAYNAGYRNYMPNGNFTFNDDFSADDLGYDWVMIRTPREGFYSVDKRGLRMMKRDVSIRDGENPSFVGYRQKHLSFEVDATLKFAPKSSSDMAGLALFQNDDFNYVFGMTLSDGGEYMIVLEKTVQGNKTIVATELLEKHESVNLKVEAEGDSYSFFYKTDDGEYRPLGGSQDGSILSTDVAGGFTGCIIGLYASSNN